MKTKVKRFISVFLCVAMLAVAMSSTTLAASKTSGKCGKNAKWSYNKKNRTLTISGKGTIKSVEWPEYNKVNVVIKKGITGIGPEAFAFMDIVKLSFPNTLTTIGAFAFGSDNGGLPSEITIPKKVTKIGEGAFSACSRLKTIKVEKGNKKYASIDGVLFNKSKTTLLFCPDGREGKYVIPNGTKTIGKHSFMDYKLKELTIPSSVKEIKKEALLSSVGILRFEGNIPKVFFARPKSRKLQRKIQRVALYFPHGYGIRFGNFSAQNPLHSISSYRA